MSKTVEPCRGEACAACPWRIDNLGKKAIKVEGEKYPWYSKQNLARLWRGIRDGEHMSCHPTDSRQKQLSGKFVGKDVQTFECTGAVILVQREMTILQSDYDSNIRAYRKARPRGITKNSIVDICERAIFGGVLAMKLSKPNLNDTNIQYEPLGIWQPR